MNFKSINSQKDIKQLMEKFNCFHDSCIKELKYYSGSYVEKARSMFPFNSIRNVNIIFQSQNSEFSTIELQFGQIHRLNLEPRLMEYDCIIYEASFFKNDNLFYWSEWEDFSLDNLNEANRTWISSEKVKWRSLENALGEQEIYKMG